MPKNNYALVKREYRIPFLLITSLFFMWGFARALLDVLNKHFQDIMDLSRTESSLIQVMVYSAYFLMAIPAGLFISRKGYRSGVVFGLLLFGAGSLLFIPSEAAMSFPSFLFALFVLGCGLVFLETAANPYVTNLGAPQTSASRLNLAQSFNGLGCLLAPVIGATFVFTPQGDGSLAVPYGVMGAIVLLAALGFTRVNLPEITPSVEETADQAPSGKAESLWRRRSFTIGLLALLCYEISEISINSFFINYVTDDGWMNAFDAAKVLSVGGLGLFLLGRFVGSLVMSRVRAELVLTVCAVLTVVGSLLVTLNVGTLSRCGLFACFAFESIMFPTIFALSLRGLNSEQTKKASSYLMMSPIGGAIGTLLMGITADATSMSTAFVVPFAGYAVVLIYAYCMLSRRFKA